MGNAEEITVVRVEPWNCVPRAEQLGGKNCLVKIYPALGAGGLIELPEHDFFIGRDGCDLDLSDPDVSRHHAKISWHDGRFIIQDLDSTNGTYVNDEIINLHQLVAGDFIRIGANFIKFLSSDHIESQYHEAIYSMMVTDGLTGIWNRRQFLDCLEKELARSRRHRRPLALAMIDLDHFKAINDTHGHLAGDNVLREFAQRICSLVREDEVFARYGGEEFAVLLDEATCAQAMAFAERVRTTISSTPFVIGDDRVTLTVSLGIGYTPGGEPLTVNQLIQRADLQLYEAKRTGRNRVCCGPTIDLPASFT